MLTGAFKTVQELTSFPPNLLPKEWTLRNFYDADYLEPLHTRGLFQYFDKAPLRFGTSMLNSIFIAVTNTIISLLFASMIAYVLAKRHVPGGNAIFLFILASYMIPWPVTLIPNFLTISALKWVNTYWGLLVPSWVSAFSVFFLRQYMLSIPDDLIDSARIDGASEFRTWLQVIMPLTTPALTALAIFSVLGNWNNFVWPLIIVQDQAHGTVPLAMRDLSGVMSQTTVGAIMVGAMLASLFPMALFLSFQRQFVDNIAMGAVKG
jgi:ABC-type glycerol-3-phosphate transport system permease component